MNPMAMVMMRATRKGEKMPVGTDVATPKTPTLCTVRVIASDPAVLFPLAMTVLMTSLFPKANEESGASCDSNVMRRGLPEAMSPNVIPGERMLPEFATPFTLRFPRYMS